MTRIATSLAFLACTVLGTACALPVRAAELEVVITGLHSPDGNVLVALHRAPESSPDATVPDAPLVANAAHPSDTDEVVVVFPDLLPGDYAVGAFHDANSNGELDANAFGMPTEGYGFSNDARGFMGPARFADAAVAVVADVKRHRVSVRVRCPGTDDGD